MKDVLEGLSYLVAIIGGVAGAVIYISRSLKDRSKSLDTYFVGSWSNEGNIGTAYIPSHYIHLKLQFNEGGLSGTLNTRNLKSGSEWQNLSVDGKRKGKKAKMEVTHIRNGQIITIARFALTYKKHGLRWIKEMGDQDLFPGVLDIWKI